jgi:hypothetical protein
VEIPSQVKQPKMKKIFVYSMIACLSLTFVPSQSSAAVKANSTLTTEATDAAAAHALLVRLNEIKTMDKSNLTAPQKKSLKKEVRTIKQQLSDIGGGVYISAGAIILILILLIIFL